MQKYLIILGSILCILLCGCGSAEEHTGIEFYTLDGDTWVAVSTSSDTTDVPNTTVTPEGTTPPETTTPDDTAEAPDATPPPSDTVVPDVCTYILNKGTKKFHDPACKSASRIKESNRGEFTGERGDVLARGYEPCKICNP